MERLLLRLKALRDTLASSLWVLPSIAVAAGIALGEWFGRLGDAGSQYSFAYIGSADAARSILSTVAGSTITVTSLTFSLTVVALQVASGQFTPRLMRTFLSDRGNQAVLAIFMGTFAYSLVLLRFVQSESDRVARNVPALGVSFAIVASLVSVGALVYFIHHLTLQLRVDRVMDEVARSTIEMIDASYEAAIVEEELPSDLGVPTDPVVVRAPESGHLNGLATNRLVAAATDAGLSVRFRPSQGQWVTEGSTLAWVWGRRTQVPDQADQEASGKDSEDGDDGEDGDLAETVVVAAADLDDDTVTQARALVLDNVHLGASRTIDGDAAFGIRQLVDIAIRALSPGINDPTTAVQALQAIGRILGRLADRDLGPLVRAAGTGFVVLPRPTFRDHVRLAVDQVVRYGAVEPAVLRAVALLLHDLAQVCDDDRRRMIRDEANLVALTVGAAGLPRASMAPVRDALAALAAVLDGDIGILPAHAD